MRKWLAVPVAMAMILLMPLTAYAATLYSPGVYCPMPYAQDPYTQTMWATTSAGNYDIRQLQIGCTTSACDAIDSVMGSIYDATTNTNNGTLTFYLPDNWKNGFLDLNVPEYKPVAKGHKVRSVWTLKKENGRYCTVVHEGIR